ncbi:hypothetical protein C1T17_13530 [Sphingobium sp. SCG-1]|uniref:hypothetical protein n=1 Tax=Sphingobium sp. SCG-1 TaxID=2072936 RepID=UPI000CD69E5B|nr:hypothetical protein [Sphingobium sp. SCG-1]AUW58960.1 hypothetical protein C1T17_13530 [Sphingobium sp. SCG-1]
MNCASSKNADEALIAVRVKIEYSSGAPEAGPHVPVASGTLHKLLSGFVLASPCTPSVLSLRL